MVRRDVFLNRLRRHQFSSTLATAAVILLAGSAQAAVYISGKVVVGTGVTPAGAVTVAFYKADSEDPTAVTQSLQNGSFVLKVPEAGQYRVVVSGSEYFPGEKALDIPAAGITSLSLSIAHRPVLHLRLVAPDGKLVASGMVEAALWVGSTHVSPKGGYTENRGIGQVSVKAIGADGIVELMAPGQPRAQKPEETVQMEERIDVSVRDATAGCGELHLDRWPEDAVSLQLQIGATLSGIVFDEHGNPRPGIMVTAIPVTEDKLERRRRKFRSQVSALTNAQGRFELPALLYNRYQVRANSPDKAYRFQFVDLTGSRTDVVLKPMLDE